MLAKHSVGNDLEVRLLHTALRISGTVPRKTHDLEKSVQPRHPLFSSFAVLGNEELLTAIAFSGSKSHKNRIYYLLS